VPLEPITEADRRRALAVLTATAGQLTFDGFREALAEALHEQLDPVSAVAVYRDAAGRGRVEPSRGETGAEVERDHPEVYREQLALLDAPPAGRRPFVATRAIPPADLDAMATVQILWARHGIREAVAQPLVNPNGFYGLVATTLGDRRPRNVERARGLLAALAPYLGRHVDALLHQERRAGPAATADALVAGARSAVLLGPGGRVRWVSPGARALFAATVGTPDPPQPVRDAGARLLAAAAAGSLDLLAAGESEVVRVGDRALVLRLRVVELDGERAALVDVDDPAGRRAEAFARQARAAGLTPRERDVARLVCEASSTRRSRSGWGSASRR